MKVYVNLTFLENLFLAEEQTERHFYIKKLLSSSHSTVKVIIDIDIDEVYKDPQKRIIYRQIAQKIAQSDPTFITSCQDPSFHESAEPKLFFVDGNDLSISQNFGCFHASSTNLEKADFLFYAEELKINNSKRDWSCLKDIKHPCNSLIITDNYLFSDKSMYLENIGSICENLMPDTLDKNFSFDVTIIGHDPKNDFHSIKEQHSNLKKYFSNRFPYTVNLTIIRETYHDRYIFTNYFQVTSGMGFALFKNRQLKQGKQTIIQFKSFAYAGRLSNTQQTINEELTKCKYINRAERIEDRLAGNRLNRLLQEDVKN